MKSYLIVTNAIKDSGLELTLDIKAYIEKKGGVCKVVSDIEENKSLNDEHIKGVEAIIVLGGDGTILRVSNAISSRDIPILGVNLGTLGFLAEIEPANVYEAIDKLFCKEYKVEERMHVSGDIYRNGELIYTGDSLNDIVVTRAGYSRIICLKVLVNGKLLDIYEGDGIIIATPTGSTGYNMSAGGPIVSPGTSLIIVTPVSPHSLTTKSIAFSSEDNITIEVVGKRDGQEEEAFASFGGRKGLALKQGDVLYINKSSRTTKLIKVYDVAFYEFLKHKLDK